MNRKNRHRVLNGLKPKRVESKAKEKLSVEATLERVLDDHKNDDLFPVEKLPPGANPEWSCKNGFIQHLSVSIELGREKLFELGRRVPYYRFIHFPVEITEEIKLQQSLGE